jgi:pimeloyl-ACP methyl ester carboxylesterase
MTVDEEGIWFEIAGDAALAPLVVVHGSMDRSAGLLRLSRRLDTQFRVVRYDRRGYGRSAAVGPPWTVRANVDDLERIVVNASASSGRTVTLFGHSFGGNVALAAAARRPELVTAVGVYETPLSWLDWWPGNSAGAAALAAEHPRDAAEAFMRRLVGDEAWDRLPDSKQAVRRAEGAAMVGELADLRREAPWHADDVIVPVAAMYGESARPHHVRAMHGLADLVSTCRVVTVPGAGHAGPHTDAAAVGDAFVDALRSMGVSVPDPTGD